MQTAISRSFVLKCVPIYAYLYDTHMYTDTEKRWHHSSSPWATTSVVQAFGCRIWSFSSLGVYEGPLSWVLVKESKLSYYNEETI